MADTPLMKQYREIKSNFEDSILFFRLGDFYEQYDLSLSNEQISILNDYILWGSYRKELYEKKNLLMFFKLFKYRKLYWSFRSYVTDFIVLYMKE